MTTSSRIGPALAAFIAADSMLTFAVSWVVTSIFRCDNSLSMSGIIAAGVFTVQALAGVIMCAAVDDLSGGTVTEEI